MLRKTKLYNDLTTLYAKVNHKKPKQTIQAEVNQLWDEIKVSKNGPVDDDRYSEEMAKLNHKLVKAQTVQTSIQSFLKRKVSNCVILFKIFIKLFSEHTRGCSKG